MEIAENVSLASLTTFKVGGNARYVARCETLEDIQRALAFAGERALPWYVLGGGSNVLASDAGYEGVIIQPLLKGITFAELHEHEGIEKNSAVVGKPGAVLVTAAAGEGWDAFVQECVERELWGIENLAGIPGLVGGAPVQNIGAYGADVSQTLVSVGVLHPQGIQRGVVQEFSSAECAFGYRDSFFKRNPSYVILSVTFSLSKKAVPHTSYADLLAYQEKNAALTTPIAIATAVREIRSKKFPDLRTSGTAGSFFKNPFITASQYELLSARYEGLPGFPAEDGSGLVKIPLAWILDKILGLRGYSQGPVRLFEQQPLVLVAEKNAKASAVDALGAEITKKVFEATGITIEREVRML